MSEANHPTPDEEVCDCGDYPNGRLRKVTDCPTHNPAGHRSVEFCLGCGKEQPCPSDCPAGSGWRWEKIV